MNRTSDRIKVLHVITRFDKGGSAENTFLTVRHLDRSRYEPVLVVGGGPAGDAADPETDAARKNRSDAVQTGVRLIALPHLVRNLNPVSDLAAFFGLIAIIHREHPRIVHTHTSKAGILGRWAAWCCRVPVIVHTPHGHVFFGYFGSLTTHLFILLERWTARITDALIALTPQEKAEHIAHGITPADTFAVIHSGVDLKPFLAAAPSHYPPESLPNSPDSGGASLGSDTGAPAEIPDVEMIRHNLGIPRGATVVATAGRLTAVKDQETLIRAVAECVRQGERLFLVLMGEGELREDLETLCERLGIADNVRFTGWKPDVACFIAACDIFCLPSRNEGMGKVLVEAMALGKPIVASDVGGIPDLIRSGENGLLVPVGDVPAWGAAIRELVHDPAARRRMGEAGRRIAPAYSVEAMIKQIDELYAKLLSDRCVQPNPETSP